MRNLTGIRAVEKIQLDEQNKVVKVFNKGIGAQISGVNSLSTALANLGDRVLPGLGDRYKKSIAEITKTSLKPPEIEGGKLDFTPASKDAERELSGFKKARILASTSAKTFGENLKNSFDKAKNSLVDFLQPNARFNEIYQRQIENIEANTRSQIRNNIERGKTRRLTEQEIALQAKANKATRIRTVFTTDLALTYEKLTGRVSGFLDRLTDSKFSKALEDQRKAIEAQNVLSLGTPLSGTGTGVLATNTAKLTAAQKAQAATAAIVSIAQENISRKTSVLSSVYARQVQQIKTLQAEKNYLAGINKVVGVSFDQLTSSVRANAIANTQLNATQKAQAVASTAGILAARTTADASRKLEFAYKRELIQLRRLQAAKKLGIPIEEAATNATVRQTARTQIQVGVLGQLRSRIASLNVLFPTFAKGVTLVGGALGGVLGVVRSLIATIAPILILATAFKAFTFITDLMEDAKQLEKGLVEVSESTREVLGITSDLGKIDTYQKLEKETLRWDNAVEKVWSKIQDIGFFLTEPLTIAFQTNSLENASKIIDLVGEAQLRSRKATLDLNQAFSETGKAGKILQGSFNASSEAISQYEKIAGVALQKASEDLEKNKQAIAITQKTLENFQRVRDERLAKGGQKVKEQESFKLLESTIKDLEMTLKMATTEADRLSASINLITEANKQRAIIQQQLNTSNIDENQSTLANKLAFATKNANQELNKQLGLLKLVREDFNKLDPKKDLKKVNSATESIKDLTNKIEKSALAQVSAIQKRFENNFITAKQAREEIEAILATGFDIDDETRSTLEKLLKPETLQQFLDARRDLIKEEVENNKTLYEKEAQLYQQLQENKLITAAEATTKIGALNIKLAQEDLRFIEESLKKESITEQERERLRFERLAKQKQILDLELKQRFNFLNQALREEEDFFKKRLDLLQTYANNQLTNSISNQKNLEKLQVEQARNTVEQLNNQFQELKLTPEINPQQLAKAEQELLTARAKFEVLEVKIQEERGKRALKQLENRGKLELLQLKLLNDKTLESRERIAAKEIEIRREVLLQEESLLKQRLETARKFGADTSEIEVQLLENQLERIEQTSSTISQQFEREANRLKAIADRFAAEADIKLTQQEQLKSTFDLQVKALEQRNALSSLFQNFQIKSLESASRLTKSRVAQIGIERELLKAQEAAAVRQAAIERKRFELKQREKDFELEILAIKTKAEAAQSKSDLANAIAKQKQLELSKTATAEEKEAASLQVEAAKENLKAQLLQTQQLESRRQLRANERIIEKQQLEQQLQARRDSLEERRVSLTKSTADDARLARERVKRARSIVTPQFERTEERKPISINIGGKEFTSKEAVKLERPRKPGLKQVEIARREDLINKPQLKEKEPLSITIDGKKFASRESIKLEPTKPDEKVTFKKANLPQSAISEIENRFKGLEGLVRNAEKRAEQKNNIIPIQKLPEPQSQPLANFNKNILTSNNSIINFDKSLNLASKGFQELSKNMGNLFKNTDFMDLGQKMKDSEIKTKDEKGVKNITFNPIIEININQSEGETPLDPEAIGDVVLDRLNSVADKLLRQV
ncbi:MAG: hypothetical protein QNJ54_27630 [Prochloraceae cyanobacterium]|nr:hypothetical protein [Prochloraceae cyanobacterium]